MPDQRRPQELEQLESPVDGIAAAARGADAMVEQFMRSLDPAAMPRTWRIVR